MPKSVAATCFRFHKKIPGDTGDFFVQDSVTKKEVNDAVPNDVDEYLS